MYNSILGKVENLSFKYSAVFLFNLPHCLTTVDGNDRYQIERLVEDALAIIGYPVITADHFRPDIKLTHLQREELERYLFRVIRVISSACYNKEIVISTTHRSLIVACV